MNLNIQSVRRFNSSLHSTSWRVGSFDSIHKAFQDYDDGQIMDRAAKLDSQFPFSYRESVTILGPNDQTENHYSRFHFFSLIRSRCS